MNSNKLIIFLTSIVLLSCSNQNNNKNVVDRKEAIDSYSYNKDSANIAIKKKTTIKIDSVHYILEKLDKGHDFSSQDYIYLLKLIKTNTDESLSEGLGYSLFNFLKDNKSRNSRMKIIIDSTESKQNESFLTNLIDLMSIDLCDDNNYSSEDLIKHFPIFDGNKKVIQYYEKVRKDSN